MDNFCFYFMNKNRLFHNALVLTGALVVVFILAALISAVVGRKARDQARIPSLDEAQIQTSEQIRKQLEELEELRQTLAPALQEDTEKTIAVQLQELEALRKAQGDSPTPPTQNDIQTQLEELEKLRNQP